jgi:enoyl-CoA hydratase
MEPLLYEESDSVAVITFNREEKLNAMNTQVITRLIVYLERVDRSPHIHAAVLTGKGRAFVAGADIQEYGDQTVEQFKTYTRLSQTMYGMIEKNRKVVIAAVNGYAFGGGFELALACDMAVAAEGAKMGLPEIKLGLLPGGGGTQRLTRIVGKKLAMFYILTGKSMTADEAQQFGLINRVCPPDTLMDYAMELARQIARNAPIAVRDGKKLIREGVEASIETALSYEQAVLSGLFQTKDAMEGIKAFNEKREALFRGE